MSDIQESIKESNKIYLDFIKYFEEKNIDPNFALYFTSAFSVFLAKTNNLQKEIFLKTLGEMWDDCSFKINIK